MSERKTERQIRYVGEGFVNEKITSETLFDRTGTPLDDEKVHKVPHYAKVVETLNTDRATHYVRIYQGIPLDPMGAYARRERNLDTKYQRVSKNTFDLYLTYLKTNNSIYLTKAQRGMLND